MSSRAWITILLASLLAAALGANSQQSPKPNDNDKPLTLAEIQALVARAIANQHTDDREINEFDRNEHTVQREGGKETAAASTDTVEHVFPTGTGEMRVTLNHNGKPVDAMAVEQQWRNIEKALVTRTNPSDPNLRDEFQREERKERAQAEMVDAIGKAFDFSWHGRVTLNGRRAIELGFEPDRDYKSSARFAVIFAHLGGTVWVDESTGQVMRVEAQLRQDVPFGGGIIAKVYRGSWIKATQSEVAPGVWEPVLATYDIQGRKFLFPASWRGQIDTSAYRRVGPPAEALLVVRREHNGTITSER
jgi:hypothetical protein